MTTDDQRNGITIHYDGETQFIELDESDMEALQKCADYSPLVPAAQSSDGREKHVEALLKPGELIARITRLNKYGLEDVARLVDLLEWDKGNHLVGANWVLTYIQDLLLRVSLHGPSTLNSNSPFDEIGYLAEALANHWSWIEDGVETFKRYPAIFTPTTAPPSPKPLLLAAATQPTPATTKHVTKPKSSGKRTKKAAA